MLLHAQLRVKQDAEITDDGLRLSDVRPNGHGAVDVAEHGETRTLTKPGEFCVR